MVNDAVDYNLDAEPLPGPLQIHLPDGFTTRDAEHMARLLEAIALGKWHYLAGVIGRLAEARAGPWAGAPGEMLMTMSVALRRWRVARLPVARADVRPDRL
jgi:hypothetical protein